MHRRSIKITRIGKAKGRKTTPKGNEPYCAPWELNGQSPYSLMLIAGTRTPASNAAKPGERAR
jgi:hypothetical protein